MLVLPAPAQLNEVTRRDYALAEGQDICVLGTLQALGNWQPDHALRLTRLESPHWQAEVILQIELFAGLATHLWTR